MILIKKIIIGAALVVCLLGKGGVFAETVTLTDYTISGSLSGDLNVVNANIDISSGDLVVEGSVKLIGGKVTVSQGSLVVDGDLIVTNTNTSGELDARISASTDIRVGGAIVVVSDNGTAYINSANGSVQAGAISTSGYGAAYVDASTFIDVAGSVYTISENSDAFVEASGGYLYAGSITTSGRGDSGVYSSGSIVVLEEIRTRSFESDAGIIVSAAGDLLAGGITIDANLSGIIALASSGNIDVKGGISTYSATLDAYIKAPYGYLKADYVFTDGYSHGYIESDEIDVKGDIHTNSETLDAYIKTGALCATNITTSGHTSSYVSAVSTIDARGILSTYSSNSEASVMAGGNISAGEIFLRGYSNAGVDCSSGRIDVRGPIVTKSTIANASVKIWSDDDLYAQEVFTNGYYHSYVDVGGDAVIRGDVATKSVNGNASVLVDGKLTARSVTTDGETGAITVGSSEIYHSEFILDVNQNWNSQLEIATDGLYKMIGNGNMLSFGENARINVKSGGTLVLNNIILDKIGTDMITCEDDTATISFHNVTWSLTDNVTFAYGNLDILDNFTIKGVDREFAYLGAGRIFVANNAALVLDSQLTFSYAAPSADKLVMNDTQSKLVLNDTTFKAWTDCTLSQGLILTDGFVQLRGESGSILDISGIDDIAIHGGVVRSGNVILPPYV